MIVDRPAVADVERSNQPLRLAFVYCRNPLPMRRADQITVAHLLEFLSARGHSIDLFCFDGDAQGNDDNALTDNDLNWLRDRCSKVVHVKRSRPAAVVGALAAMMRGKPLQVGWLTSRKLAKALSESLESEHYDLLYAYYFRSAETVVKAINMSHAPGGSTPTVLAMQLSQTLNTKRIRDNATNVVTRLVFGVESRLVSRYEARVWKRFSRVALIGPADVEAIVSECRGQGLEPIDNWFFSPHGTDIRKFRPKEGITPIPRSVLFAGTLFYPPNIQAAVWLVKSIWPVVRSRVPDATLRIVGRDPSPEVLALSSEAEGVQVIANVPDISQYMAEAEVCVNPVRAAGGMQNKLIEYLASGRPVVATNVANEGIAAPGDALKVAESAEDFANAVVELLTNRSAAEDMGRAAREFAWREWSWEAHFLKLESNFMALLSEQRVIQD
ncbi:MAG: glycosyltransferase [Mycolicibacterium rufum]|nr:glycosyltransferase [Mycolicibacterium rufum]